jgi:tetratricopeptide (TPR) repeat protein
MSSSPDPLPSWLRVGVPALIFLFAYLCFSPALDGAFLNWDDNLVLTDHDSWKGLGGDQIGWAFSTFRAGHYHPLTWLSFGLDYELWGMNSRGYHLVNLILHATTATLFYFVLVWLLERSGRFAGREIVSRLAAAAGALFFAIHPLRVESVAWITERRDVLSGCFLILAVLAWLRWTEQGERRKRWYALALVAFALSLLSKAWAITLPAVLLILDICPLRRFVPGRRRALLIEKAPFAVMAVIAGVVALIAQKHAGAMNIVQDHNAVDRIMQSGYGLFFYLAKTIAPVAQNPLYALKPTFDPFEAKYLAGAAAAVIVTVAVIAVRRRRPEFLAAWAIYAVSVAPVLGLTQSGPQLVAERYSYLSCLPFAVVAAAGLAALMRRVGRGPLVVASIALAALGFQSWNYSHEWKDSISLWTRAVRQDPENAQAWFNLGSAKLDLATQKEDRELMKEAFADLSRVIEIDPKYASAYINRGIARMERDPKGAIADFDAAIRIIPDYADAFVNRGWVRFGTGDAAGGIADFDSAIRINPRHYQAHLRRGIARLGRRDLSGAREDLAAAIRLKPLDPDAFYVRGQAREEGGDLDGAIEDYAQALNLGGTSWEKKKRDRAEELLARARRRKVGR